MTSHQTIITQGNNHIQLCDIKLCECGCGQPVNWSIWDKKWNTHINRHGNFITNGLEQWNQYIHENSDLIKIPLCKCGCGNQVKLNIQSKKWNEYLKGHGNLDVIGFKKGHKPWNTGLKGGTVGSFKKGQVPWNKGLSKEIDDRVRNNGISTSTTKKRQFKNGEIVHPRGMKGKKNKWGHHTEESKKMMSKNSIGKNTGENNPRWLGGISYEPYCPKFNNVLKESIREQFNHTCFICGISQDEQMNQQRDRGVRAFKLDIHHVNYDKNCLCDGIVCDFVPLCRSCHTKTTNSRQYWEAELIKKLRGIEL